MNVSVLKKSYASLTSGIQWLRIMVAFSIFGLIVAIFALINQTERVILQPVTLTDTAWVDEDMASQEYKTGWGAYLGMLMGNITPGKLGFVKDRIEPLLAPEIYNETLQAFETQAQDLRENRISMSFELRSVDYEPTTGKVFAYGYRYAQGSGSKDEVRSERTYEYRMEIREYRPMITHINTYEGKPRTERVLRMIEKRSGDRSE